MKRKYLVLLHVSVWLILVINDVVPGFRQNAYALNDLPKSIALLGRYTAIVLGFYSISALCFYGSYRAVAPLLFLQRRYGRALFAAIGLLAALVGWRYLLEFHFFKPVLGFDNYRGNKVEAFGYVENIFWYYFPNYFVYGLMYFLGENWVKNRHRQEALQREKLTAELAFLRSQINPHFLFNTLNDIYSLSYRKSDDAPQAILKLSELLRYMLREGSGDFVPLQGEIAYLENLVSLQRTGAKGAAFITFEIEGYVGGQQVASLLFVAFVENAFKHGVTDDPESPVRIHLQAAADRLAFSVSNRVSGGQKDHANGIGLANVRRRLELLYPDRHTLTIHPGDVYRVELTLLLSP